MYEQNTSYLVKDSKSGVKNLNKTFLRNCTKSTKMALLLHLNFQKTSRGAFPLPPPKAVCVPRFASKYSNSAGKNVKMWCPSTTLKKFLIRTLHETFSKSLFKPFSRSHIYIMYLTRTEPYIPILLS